MFASESLAVHLGRGMVGFGAVALGIGSGNFVIMLLLLLVGLIALRGCPMCWTVGLFETIVNLYHRRRGNPDILLCANCNAVGHGQTVNEPLLPLPSSNEQR